MIWNRNSSGIILPSENKMIRRASGLITPMTDIERQAEYFCSKYDCIAHYQAISGNGLHPIHIKDKKEKICRFCKRDSSKTKFNNDCHAISELIGNKSIFLDNECVDCNKFFGRRLEDEFAKYLGPVRTISQTIGKEGVPSYKKMNGTFRMDVTDKETVIQDVIDSGNTDIFEDHMEFHLVKDTYIPIAAFKALVFMALSIMPENEFKVFESTIDWLREESHNDSKYNMDDYASRVIERFVPGPKPLPIQVWIARRKPNIYDAPYCQFVLEFDNFSFQIMVPCPEMDGVLLRTNLKISVFPSTFDLNEKDYRKFGHTELHVKNLSGKEKMKGEKSELCISFNEKKEDFSSKGKNMQDMAEEHGVKALKPLKEKKGSDC